MEERPGLRRRAGAWLARQPVIENILRLFSGALLYSSLDDRLAFRDALQKALRKKVPPYALKRTYCLGGMTLICFVNQVVTGILLSVYYEPSPEGAYMSVQYIMHEVPMGWLLRQLHAWGAHLMILFMILHMLKVFWQKTYQSPREFTWVAGALLFFITLFMSFSGYLLPWDQLSFWGTTVGTEMPGSVPLVGDYMQTLMRGGPTVTGATLSRFYTTHTVVLPWVITGLLVAHFALVRRLGISKPL